MIDFQPISQIIHIDKTKPLPIYKQIVEAVEKAIMQNLLKPGDPIPSINTVASEHCIARGSILKAYNELRSSGYIDSIPGKGYFITQGLDCGKKHIFLLMNTFNSHREAFYKSFVKNLKRKAKVDLFFHHHNIDIFEGLINNNISNYNTYVIIPASHKKSYQVLKKLDQHNLYILDSKLKNTGAQTAGIFQNYLQNIPAFLEASIERIKAYKRIILLFSSNMRNREVIKGFKAFARKHPTLNTKVIKQTELFTPMREDLCLIMDDNDLVNIVLYSKSKKWKLGKDLGIISFYENPLKSVIENGISTISPDYEQMGTSLAKLILEGKKERIENPFLLFDRKSF